MLSMVSFCLFSKFSSVILAFVSSILVCEEKKSLRTSALSLFSQMISPWLRRGGILLDCEGFVTRFKVFHQSLGLGVLSFSLSASLSLTSCFDFLISLFLIFLYASWSELALVFLYLV